MKFIDARIMSNEEIQKLMSKPYFDDVKLSDKVQKSIEKNFGSNLSAREVVDKIILDIKNYGDEKIVYYSNLIDKVDFNIEDILVQEEEFLEAEKLCDKKIVISLFNAIQNVERFHIEQLPKTWLTDRKYGSMLGQKNTPLERVGLYIPGGTAAYPSSVIMNAVPAKVAGVNEIIMCVPPSKDGKVNPYVLLAAKKIGVDKIFKIGGAQAIAAMAFGTKSVPKVDKITGPGNIFVTLAKKAVYGYCDIDMLAGPSEILIIADKSAKAEYIAADLLSQAEHDPLASSILVTDCEKLSKDVLKEVYEQLEKLPRKELTELSLKEQGMIVLVNDLTEAIKVSNLSAPEHLEVITKDPFALLPYIKHAGAVFLGNYSPEPLGDYFAGPNHTLPTGGTARFYSVLNVETFMKKTSIIYYTKDALKEDSEDIIRLAEAEGLNAHANAIRLRMGENKNE